MRGREGALKPGLLTTVLDKVVKMVSLASPLPQLSSHVVVLLPVGSSPRRVPGRVWPFIGFLGFRRAP